MSHVVSTRYGLTYRRLVEQWVARYGTEPPLSVAVDLASIALFSGRVVS